MTVWLLDSLRAGSYSLRQYPNTLHAPARRAKRWLWHAPDKTSAIHHPRTGRSIMPTYILLSTLTPEGRQTLHRNPERLEEVREITEFGCKVVAQYAVLGP